MLDLRQNARCDLFDAAFTVNALDPTQALNSATKSISDEALIFNAAGLDAILLSAAPSRSPVRIDLQDDAHLRHRIPSPVREQGEDLFIVELTCVRLIRQGRGVKALTDHVTPRGEGRLNKLRQELPPSGREEHDLAPRVDLSVPREQELSQALPERRAARLPQMERFWSRFRDCADPKVLN
jgi:hypothetical protein